MVLASCVATLVGHVHEIQEFSAQWGERRHIAHDGNGFAIERGEGFQAYGVGKL